MKLGKRGSNNEELLMLVADIARAVNVLDLEEKIVVAYRHSGYLFGEIAKELRIRKNNIINYYDSAIIKMIFYLNEYKHVGTESEVNVV
jgi:hypothetical protein